MADEVPPAAAETAVPELLAADDDAGGDDADSSLGAEVLSDTTSVASSIRRYREENGRTYHAFKDGKYYYPNDDTENDRLDLQHNLFILTYDGKLGTSPLNDKDAKVGRVLDVGTGTGIWAMDFGDEHPEAEVIGFDLSPIQPPFVPPNVFFEIMDLEDEWTFSRKFQYIHSRMMNSSVSNWAEYLARCYRHLEPGGTVEIQEIGIIPMCDDDTLKDDMAIYRGCVHLEEAVGMIGKKFQDLNTIKDLLQDAGFEAIVEHKYKWPSNPWPRDKKHKELGAWAYQNISSGLIGFFMAPLTRVLGWQKEEVEVLSAQARKDLGDKSIHAYWPIISIYAKKPEDAVDPEPEEPAPEAPANVATE